MNKHKYKIFTFAALTTTATVVVHYQPYYCCYCTVKTIIRVLQTAELLNGVLEISIIQRRAVDLPYY